MLKTRLSLMNLDLLVSHVTNSPISKEPTAFWGTYVDIVIAHVIEVLTILLTTNGPPKHLCCS